MSEDEQSVRALAQLMGAKVCVLGSTLYPIQISTLGTNNRIRGGYFNGVSYQSSHFQNWKEALKAVKGITAEV